MPLCLCALLALLGAAIPTHADPLRLGDGRPFACVYYFGHWWDPWKSDDRPIRKDFSRLKDMGISVLCVDHEWSQAIDGNWRLLDRGHRLARESGMGIVPWLSLKSWSDIAAGSSPSDGDQPVRISHDLVVVLEGREWAYL